jgi:prepilin-type N-terminal cleavage/methylation domain-containing protein
VDPHGVDRRRDERGFTLIEVMIAILLSAITALGMIGLFRAQARAGAFSRRETEAAVLAEDRLEVLRTKAVSTVASTTTETNLTEAGLVVTSPTPGPYTRTSVVSINGTQVDIAVTVSWDDGRQTKSVTVRTFRSGS